MIGEAYQENFETLRRAFANNDVCLMECVDKTTKKPVIVICAVQKIGKEVEFVPLAKMFDDNAFDEVDPPG